MKIISGKIIKPQKVVIYGPEGIGKSTFAAQFPKPLFIDTEGSTSHLEVDRLPRPTSWQMLKQYIKDLKGDTMGYHTLVIDTADWAERLCEEAICQSNGKVGIEDFGYGKGYTYVKEEFGRLLDSLSDLIDAGMNVVLTAHSIIRKFELPEETGSYDRYELKLGQKAGNQCAALAKEWADMVLFVNYKEIVITTKDNKKKVSGGKRVMYTAHNPCWDAKNRHGLAEELPFDYQEIANCIPVMNPVTPQPTPAEPEPAPKAPDPPKESPQPPIQAETKQPDVQAPDAIPQALADLMAANDVTAQDIQQAVAYKGYFPADMPIADYPEDFVMGCLVAAFPQMLQVINQLKKVPF
ncbi:ATP-binding protein [Megasphaera elsdenii]|uniref:ATP-binding protein n=1 Tax=Megasphaera elsdenii TaxID=907 RepID=UPI001956A883|nr:ATP-binding protein [Megasphaera elsdenii]MBM6701742.1 ATP-binding protein [Megasphaera elsdenii]